MDKRHFEQHRRLDGRRLDDGHPCIFGNI